MNTWREITVENINSDIIENLFNNEIGVVRIKNFLTLQECKNFEKDIDMVGIDFYENVEPPIGKIGITQFEHINSNKNKYFDKHEIVKQKISQIRQHSEILNRVIQLFNLSEYNKVGIAQEKDLDKCYFAGLIRMINTALLHRDFGQDDGKGWSIGEVEKQLAWNIFISSSSKEGEGQVFKRFWNPNDEKFKISNSYAYNEKLVENSPNLFYKPIVGDLVFFNSRNFHKVHSSNSKKRRITMSSFIGKTKNNEIVFWS